MAIKSFKPKGGTLSSLVLWYLQRNIPVRVLRARAKELFPRSVKNIDEYLKYWRKTFRGGEYITSLGVNEGVNLNRIASRTNTADTLRVSVSLRFNNPVSSKRQSMGFSLDIDTPSVKGDILRSIRNIVVSSLYEHYKALGISFSDMSKRVRDIEIKQAEFI